MQPPKTISELTQRLRQSQTDNKKRDDLVTLCREMYRMTRERKSGFLGTGANQWRSKVSPEYWQSSNRAHNAVDVLTAVLSGHVPQYHVTVPGDFVTSVPSRAEKFISGVWRVNSRRQMVDLYRKLVFRTILDGRAGIRVYWNPSYNEPDDLITVPNPDNPEESWAVAQYSPDRFPISIDIVKIDKLFPLGRGLLGKPFDQIMHVESRTPADVWYEWYGEPEADLSFYDGLKELKFRAHFCWA